MIYTNCKITVKANNISTIDRVIYLYQGDKGIDIYFTIIDSPYKYVSDSNENILDYTNASFAQLVIKREHAAPIITEKRPTVDGQAVLTITSDMVDELHELGAYDFQIRLFSEDDSARMTLPPVIGGIVVKEPLVTDESTALTDTGVIDLAVIDENGEETAVFDDEGNYNKNNWTKGMIISSERMNNIDEAIDTINQIARANNEVIIPDEYITEDELNAKGYLTEHQSLEGYVTEEGLSERGFLTSIPEGYITEDELEAKGYLTEHQSLEGYATEEYVDSVISNIDIEGGYDDTEIRALIDVKADIDHTHEGYLTSIPEEYVTEDELEAKGYLTEHQDISGKADIGHTHEEYLTTVPEEYVTEDELNAKGYLTEHQDISQLATKDELNNKSDKDHTHEEYLADIPEEYVTEEELNSKGYLTEHQDISGKSDIGHTHEEYLTAIPDEYVTEDELASKNLLSSTTITRIEIVDVLPDTEEEGVLYMVKKTE